MIQYFKKIIIKLIGGTTLFRWAYNNLFSNSRNRIIEKTIKELKEIENYDQPSLKKLNDSCLKDILIHAYQTVPYYRILFDSTDFDPSTNIEAFKNLPILSKHIINSEKDNLLSSSFNKKELLQNFTSGSTGEPTEFFRDKFAAEKDNAHHYYCYSLMGYEPKDRIIGVFGRNLPEDVLQKNIYWMKNSGSQIFGEYTFSAHYLDDFSASFYIDKLIMLKPAIIRGYPSAVNKLALYILQEKVNIEFKIKGINLTSEVCTEDQRNNIERAFNTQVYLEYGNKELCMFSYTKDKTYVYESSPIYCYLEVINEDGTDTKIGETGKVITTGFINRGMPFIRYDTGDLAVVESRNGGIVQLKDVVGRQHDYLIDINGDKFYQIRLNSSFYIQNLSAFKEIKIWQFRQSKIGESDVLIVPTKNFTEENRFTIENSFASFEGLKFNFKYVKEIAKPKSGKHLFFVREIPQS